MQGAGQEMDGRWGGCGNGGNLGFEQFLWFSRFRRRRGAVTGEGDWGAKGVDAVGRSQEETPVVTWEDFDRSGERGIWPLAGLWSRLVSEGEEGVKNTVEALVFIQP